MRYFVVFVLLVGAISIGYAVGQSGTSFTELICGGEKKPGKTPG